MMLFLSLKCLNVHCHSRRCSKYCPSVKWNHRAALIRDTTAFMQKRRKLTVGEGLTPEAKSWPDINPATLIMTIHVTLVQYENRVISKCGRLLLVLFFLFLKRFTMWMCCNLSCLCLVSLNFISLQLYDLAYFYLCLFLVVEFPADVVAQQIHSLF